MGDSGASNTPEEALYRAYYLLALCARVGPRASYGSDQTGSRGPYAMLKPHAANGDLVRHPLVLDALLDRLRRFKTQHSRVGDLNWEVGLPELLLSCRELRADDLLRIDKVAARIAELRWMRQRVAEHPDADITVLEGMLARGIPDGDPLAALVMQRLAPMRDARARAHYRAARRTRAEERLKAHLEHADLAGYALRRFRTEGLSVEETLALARVGPTSDDGMVGGGKGASAPDASDFDPDDLPATLSPERAAALADGDAPTAEELAAWRAYRLEQALEDEDAEQFDVWKLVPHHGTPVYAISWRDADGGAMAFDGFHATIADVRAALAARHDAFDLWLDDDA